MSKSNRCPSAKRLLFARSVCIGPNFYHYIGNQGLIRYQTLDRCHEAGDECTEPNDLFAERLCVKRKSSSTLDNLYTQIL